MRIARHQRLEQLLVLGRKTIGEEEVIHNHKLKGTSSSCLRMVGAQSLLVTQKP
jgi:hypothetical protein